jgi:hypothetical protein
MRSAEVVKVKHLLQCKFRGNQSTSLSWAKVELLWEWPALFIFVPINRRYSMAQWPPPLASCTSTHGS